jgi:hypothetical protein
MDLSDLAEPRVLIEVPPELFQLANPKVSAFAVV